MALRLILMGLVACLALDAPRAEICCTAEVVAAVASCESMPVPSMPSGLDAFAAETTLPQTAMIEVVGVSELVAATPKAPMIEIVELDEAPVCDGDSQFQAVVDGMVKTFVADSAVPALISEQVPQMVELDDTLDIDPALETVSGYGEEVAETPQPSRLSQALRLTSRAVDAWADLLK